MLGPEIAAGYRIVQNDSFDPATQVSLGRSSFGHEVRLNAVLPACGLLVLVGFIEPHLFAGFSGGPKSIMPGMAGQATVLGNHDAGMIADPAATWGRIDGNPIWEEAREVLRRLLALGGRAPSLPPQRDARTRPRPSRASSPANGRRPTAAAAPSSARRP